MNKFYQAIAIILAITCISFALVITVADMSGASVEELTPLFYFGSLMGLASIAFGISARE